MQKYIEYALYMNAGEKVHKWIQSTLKNYLDKNIHSQDEIEHIIDYLLSDEAPKNIAGMSYDEAKKNTEKWNAALMKKGSHIKEMDGDIETILDFKDGFKIVKLIGKAAYEREGYLMRHCVASYFGKSVEIYSLRDKDNMPHCTMEKDNQIKGKGNGDIHPNYIGYVVAFLEKIGMTVGDNEMKHLGYINMENFKKELSKDTKYFNKVYLPKDAKLIDREGNQFASLELLNVIPLISKVGESLKINFELHSFIKLSVEYMKRTIKVSKKASATAGNGAHSATAGNGANSATAGPYANSATAGERAHSATAGYGAHSATAGYGAHSATAGNGAHSATAGYGANSATAGYGANSATAGNGAHSATAGYGAHSATAGPYAHSATAGNDANSATAGNDANSATAGERAHSATAGPYANSATAGYGAHSATAGNDAHSATAGNDANSATAGYGANSATAGNGAHSATAGNDANSATAGYGANSATAGNDANSATAGPYAHSATAGERANSATAGYGAHSATAGNDAIACSVGRKAKAKASLGCWIVLAEWKEGKEFTDAKPIAIESIKVDGNKIKADTWYKLENGEFVITDDSN